MGQFQQGSLYLTKKTIVPLARCNFSFYFSHTFCSRAVATAREKTERYEREKFLEKNAASIAREETLRAIEDDKAARKDTPGAKR